jgi:ribosome-binding factor A
MSNLKPNHSPIGRRPLRIGAEILRDLPGIIRSNISLPDDLMITILDVEVTDDLSHAKVYFSIFGEHEEARALRTQKLLNDNRALVRHEIAQRLVMRQHPDIKFIYDNTPAHAAHIEALLKQVREEKSPGDPE